MTWCLCKLCAYKIIRFIHHLDEKVLVENTINFFFNLKKNEGQKN